MTCYIPLILTIYSDSTCGEIYGTIDFESNLKLPQTIVIPCTDSVLLVVSHIILRDDILNQIVCFFNIVQTALDPPLVLNLYVADFSYELLKKCVNACRDKYVKIVRKSLGKNVQFTKKLWQFYLQYVTILPPEDLFYVNLYCQKVSRIILLQQKFLNMGLNNVKRKRRFGSGGRP